MASRSALALLIISTQSVFSFAFFVIIQYDLPGIRKKNTQASAGVIAVYMRERERERERES